MVVFVVQGHEAVGIPRKGAIEVPEYPRLARSAPGALRGVPPRGSLEAHGAGRLEAASEHGRLEVVYHREAGDIEVLVVFRAPDAQTTPGSRGFWSDIADKNEIVVEWRSMQPIAQVVHEVARAALDEAVVIV